MKTLVMGAAIVDVIMQFDRLPQRGEDVVCHETMETIGGCAYNVAGILRNMGIQHDLFVPVGAGMHAELIAEKLKSDGYEILIRDEEMDNGYSLCLVEKDGERTFITVKGMEGVFKKVWFDAIVEEQYQNIYLAGYQVCGKSGIIIADWLKTLCGKAIFFAPGPMITEIDGGVMDDILSLRPIVHLNEKELLDFVRGTSVEECLKKLYECTHNLVIVTLGERGTMYYDGTQMHLVDAFPTTVVDTIGAGDSHIAAIIGGYSRGMDVEDGIRLANKVASNMVGMKGSTVKQEVFEEWNMEREVCDEQNKGVF